MELHNILTYSDEWDKLLNRLLTEGEVTSYRNQIIDFKLKTGTKTGGWIFKKEEPVYSYYTVWITNKSSHYGMLYKKDDRPLPDEDLRSPKQGTLEKLYILERKLLSRNWYK